MKNKIFLTLASILTATSMLAQDFEYQGVKYTVLDASAKTVTTKAGKNYPIATGHDNFQGDLVIPETVYNGSTAYTVTEIGAYSFYNNTDVNGHNNITSISLPNTLTKIGEDAFGYNENFTTIVIPEGITGRTETASFEYCRGLETIVLPAGIERFGSSYFGGCNNIKTIVCYAVEPPYTTPATITQSAQNYGANITLYVPDGSQQAYEDFKYGTSATAWGAWHYMNIKSVDEWPGLDEPDQPGEPEMPMVNLTVVYPDGSESVVPTPANAPVNVLINPLNRWTINSVTHDNVDVTDLVDPQTGRYLSANLIADNSVITIVAVESVTIEPIEPEEPDVIETASAILMTVDQSRHLGIYLENNDTELHALAADIVSWSSDNDDIASVDADGAVTGNKYGDAVITAYNAAGQSIMAFDVYVGPVLTVVYPDGSKVNHYIPYNTQANITIAPSARWQITSASHDDTDVTDDVKNGKYVSADPLTDNSTITLVANEYEEHTVGAESVGADTDIRILVNGRTLTIVGAEDSDAVSVYNVQGKVVYQGLSKTVTLNEGGVYVVRVGTRAYKLAIL